LQAGFRAQRGQGPMAFLRARRFDLARAQLLSASPRDTITNIAGNCGFEHLGRFSVEYRKRYGESPSQTLGRARSSRP